LASWQRNQAKQRVDGWFHLLTNQLLCRLSYPGNVFFISMLARQIFH
jgi:hypothetical protein